MGIAPKLTRRQFLQLCVAGPLVLTTATACGYQSNFDLGIYQHPGHEAFYLSEHAGLLPTSVVLRKSQSAEAVLSSMLKGELDAATLALDEFLSCLHGGIPLKIVAVLSQSCGSDAFLSKPELGSAAALKGKVIALEPRASAELLLQYYLESSGLQRQDVELAYLPQLKQLMAWQEGYIDAAISCPPVCHYIERNGAQPLFAAHHSAPTSFQVLAIRADRMNWLSNTPALLLNSFYLGLRQQELFKGDTLRRTALWRNLTLAETRRYFASVLHPGPAENLQLMADSSALGKTLLQLQQWMPELRHPIAAAGLLHPAALKQLVHNG